MPRSRGTAKTGGRKKGTPNRITATAREVCERNQIDPFEILLYFASGNQKALGCSWEIHPALRLRAAIEACSFILPKRKPADSIETAQEEIGDLLFGTTWRELPELHRNQSVNTSLAEKASETLLPTGFKDSENL